MQQHTSTAKRRTKFSTDEEHEKRRAGKTAAKAEAKGRNDETACDKGNGAADEGNEETKAVAAEVKCQRSNNETAQSDGAKDEAKAEGNEEGPSASYGTETRKRSSNRGGDSMQQEDSSEKPPNEEAKGERERGRSHEKRHERPGATVSAERDTSSEGKKRMKCAEIMRERVSERRSLSTISAME